VSIESFIIMKDFERLNYALGEAGVKKYGRNRKVAELTGYSEARISEMLSGKLPLNPKFKMIVCVKFSISENFIDTGEGDIILPVAADKMEHYEALSEPAKKALKLFQQHPEKAWEFYAAILERAEKSNNDKK